MKLCEAAVPTEQFGHPWHESAAAVSAALKPWPVPHQACLVVNLPGLELAEKDGHASVHSELDLSHRRHEMCRFQAITPRPSKSR